MHCPFKTVYVLTWKSFIFQSESKERQEGGGAAGAAGGGAAAAGAVGVGW